ncbi:acyl-CoA carboxylase subunit epsilon [Microbacterium schleiferi]|uniref:Acyl-CoA carboxylase subunit epsilon n=1 Tax=Microbacterium schleiferi TaxID=69362 RepID=A0A7S8MYV8_9MICO|nr:acyl-CoA carboxylase subunit epsilon [Microbacterium schleiferi]QPE05188.1 acyl-CoA carboxylase subunit epsilon [Microbacterium schleiferi]
MSNRDEPDQERDPAVPITIVRGDATAEELAAVVAVVSEHYVTEHAEAVADEPRRSAWALSQRALREPLRRELGWNRSPC